MLRSKKFWLRLLVIVFVIYTVIWFIAAWFAKGEINKQITGLNGDIQVEAETVKVVGYPLSFMAKLSNVTVSGASLPFESASIDEVSAGIKLLSPTTIRASLDGIGLNADVEGMPIYAKIAALDISAKRSAHIPKVSIDAQDLSIHDRSHQDAPALFTSAGIMVHSKSLKSSGGILDAFAQLNIDLGKSQLQLPTEGAKIFEITSGSIIAKAKGTTQFKLDPLDMTNFDLVAWSKSGGIFDIEDGEINLADNSKLQLSGQIGMDSDMNPDGQVNVKLANYVDLLGKLDEAKVLDLLDEPTREMLPNGLDSLSTMFTGHTETVVVPVGFHGGKIWAGPIPF